MPGFAAMDLGHGPWMEAGHPGIGTALQSVMLMERQPAARELLLEVDKSRALGLRFGSTRRGLP